MDVADSIDKTLLDKSVDSVLDDRDEWPAIKFKDCDLIGIPLRVIIGERTLKGGYI